LIVPLVRGHEVASAAAPLHVAQEFVARPPGRGLARPAPERKGAELEWKPESMGEIPYCPSHLPAVRLNSVVRMGHDKRQPQRRSGAVQ
jgi:hypothetical protein